MKKSALYVMFVLLLLGMLPNPLSASENNPMHTKSITSEIPADVKIMLDRLNEIKDMDKSNLDRAERKALRKEVRTIKKDIRASGNGLYISSGAIIIILLLIIIL